MFLSVKLCWCSATGVVCQLAALGMVSQNAIFDSFGTREQLPCTEAAVEQARSEAATQALARFAVAAAQLNKRLARESIGALYACRREKTCYAVVLRRKTL